MKKFLLLSCALMVTSLTYAQQPSYTIEDESIHVEGDFYGEENRSIQINVYKFNEQGIATQLDSYNEKTNYDMILPIGWTYIIEFKPADGCESKLIFLDALQPNYTFELDVDFTSPFNLHITCSEQDGYSWYFVIEGY